LGLAAAEGLIFPQPRPAWRNSMSEEMKWFTVAVILSTAFGSTALWKTGQAWLAIGAFISIFAIVFVAARKERKRRSTL
jgi:hypothetical protein